jgi:hypothetical protein
MIYLCVLTSNLKHKTRHEVGMTAGGKSVAVFLCSFDVVRWGESLLFKGSHRDESTLRARPAGGPRSSGRACSHPDANL